MVNEITILELWIFGIVFSILFTLVIIMFVYFSVKDKLHSSYHKGYNEHRNDKANYYEKLRELNDDFTSLMKEIKDTEMEFNVNFIQTLIDFGNKIRKFKNKN